MNEIQALIIFVSLIVGAVILVFQGARIKNLEDVTEWIIKIAEARDAEDHRRDIQIEILLELKKMEEKTEDEKMKAVIQERRLELETKLFREFVK